MIKEKPVTMFSIMITTKSKKKKKKENTVIVASMDLGDYFHQIEILYHPKW